jgi:hypothetical protein
MSLDRVKPLKMESIASGGDSEDEYPTPLDPNHDHVDCRGVVLQDSTGIDEQVVVTRAGGDMTFKDVYNPTPVTLTQIRTTTTALIAWSGSFILDLQGQIVTV